MKTYLPEAKKIIKWYLLDAQGVALGRVASRAALLLRDKSNPDYTPFFDRGNAVVIVNASKILLSGRKLLQKRYHSHSGYPGGQRSFSVERLGWQKVLRKAIYGMLPKNKLRDRMITRLYIYEGPEHQFDAQRPVKVEL